MLAVLITALRATHSIPDSEEASAEIIIKYVYRKQVVAAKKGGEEKDPSCVSKRWK